MKYKAVQLDILHVKPVNFVLLVRVISFPATVVLFM